LEKSQIGTDLVRLDICIVLAEGVGMLLGTVEAATEAEAIAKGGKEFGREESKLVAVRHP